MIVAGFIKACEKRPVSIDKMEEITDEIERTIQKKYVLRLTTTLLS